MDTTNPCCSCSASPVTSVTARCQQVRSFRSNRSPADDANLAGATRLVKQLGYLTLKPCAVALCSLPFVDPSVSSLISESSGAHPDLRPLRLSAGATSRSPSSRGSLIPPGYSRNSRAKPDSASGRILLNWRAQLGPPNFATPVESLSVPVGAIHPLRSRPIGPVGGQSGAPAFRGLSTRQRGGRKGATHMSGGPSREGRVGATHMSRFRRLQAGFIPPGFTRLGGSV